MDDFIEVSSKVYEELKAENERLKKESERFRTTVLLLLDRIKQNEQHDIRNLNV